MRRTRPARCLARRFACTALAAALTAGSAFAAPPVPKPEPRPAVAEAPAPVDAWLRACAGNGLRNAKLYAARALGIELMKRSADRNQARSTLDIDRQLVPMLGQLRHRGVPEPELNRLEDALTGLTELTAQNAVASQVDAVVRMADAAATACTRMAGRIDASATDRVLAEHMGRMLDLSQRIAMDYLAAALGERKRAVAPAALVVEMETHLAELRKLAAPDSDLQQSQLLLDGQWVFLKRAVQSLRTDGRQQVEDVGRASELMHEVIEGTLTRLSAKAARVV